MSTSDPARAVLIATLRHAHECLDAALSHLGIDDEATTDDVAAARLLIASALLVGRTLSEPAGDPLPTARAAPVIRQER